MKKQRNYDKRVRQTRVFLDDYFVIRGLSRQAGISMAEALHKLLVGLKPETKPEAVATKPAFQVSAQPALRVSAQPALRVRSQPMLATNGNKAGVFVIKPKGGITQ